MFVFVWLYYFYYKIFNFYDKSNMYYMINTQTGCTIPYHYMMRLTFIKDVVKHIKK